MPRQQILLPLPPPQNTPQALTSFVASRPSLEDLVNHFTIQNLQFQQRTNSSIHNLETQIGQLTTLINTMQAQGSNQLPA